MQNAEVTHTTETISPEVAARMLKHNRHNRKENPRRVAVLAADMEKGRWQENGEAGITFDWNGDIAGGQHTLLAVVKSGVTIRCRVTRGVDPDARHTMNDSMKQRLTDDLSVWGVKNASEASTLLYKVMTWERVASQNDGQGGLAAWRNGRFSRGDLAASWPRYAAGVTETVAATQKYAGRWPGNRGAMQFFWWLLREKHGFDADMVAMFFDYVTFGSQEENRALFQRLWKKFRDDSRADRQVFWLCRTWNAFLKDERLTKLQEPRGGISDPYPKLRRP